MARYRDLVEILKRKGCQNIQLPLDDIIPFIKYTVKAKYQEKLYFMIENGKFKVSNQPNKYSQPKQQLVS